MPNLRAVLFDLDGVLVDSHEAWFHLLNLAARHFRTPDVTRQRFDGSWGQGIDADLREFFPGCDAEKVARFYAKHLLDFDTHIHVEAGARETLCRLREAEIPRGVVTNTPTLLARDILAWAGLIGMVDVTVGAEPEVPSKPAPDMILHACHELQVEPRHVLVVGDSRFDAEAAAAAHAEYLPYKSKAAGSAQTLDDVAERLLQGR